MKKKYIRKLTKSGLYSFCLNIPKNLVKQLKWREHQKLVLDKIGQKLVIKDWKKK